MTGFVLHGSFRATSNWRIAIRRWPLVIRKTPRFLNLALKAKGLAHDCVQVRANKASYSQDRRNKGVRGRGFKRAKDPPRQREAETGARFVARLLSGIKQVWQRPRKKVKGDRTLVTKFPEMGKEDFTAESIEKNRKEHAEHAESFVGFGLRPARKPSAERNCSVLMSTQHSDPLRGTSCWAKICRPRHMPRAKPARGIDVAAGWIVRHRSHAP
jgi:hypothetical protein